MSPDCQTRFNRLKLTGLAGLAAACLVSLGSPASAVCVQRPFVDASGASRPFELAVPAGEVAEYAAKGFVTTPCALNAAQLVAMGTNVCRMKALGNQAVQNRFESVLGAPPAKMCASVTAVAKASGVALPVDAQTPTLPMKGAN